MSKKANPMKKLVALAALGLAGIAAAEPYAGSGKITVNDINWFANWTSLVFGEGMLEYTGTGGSVSAPVTIDTQEEGRGVFTFSVPAGEQLELLSPLTIMSGGIMATGGGTVKLVGASMPNGKVGHGDDGEPIEWNENGTTASGFMTGLNMSGGKFLFEGPGPFVFTTAATIGSANSPDSSLEISGTGRENSFSQFPELTLGKFGFVNHAGAKPSVHRLKIRNATASIGRVITQFSNVISNDERGSDCYIELDNATVTNEENHTRLAIHKGNYGLTLRNGSTYTAGKANYRFGLQTTSGQQISTGEVAVLEGSILKTFSYNPIGTDKVNSALRVEGGSTLAVSRANTSSDNGEGAHVKFDNATLASWRMTTTENEPVHSLVADWFSGFANPVEVGAGGMTLFSDNYSEFNARLAPAEGVSGTVNATIAGGGTVAFRTLPDTVGISVAEGSELKIASPQTDAAKEVSLAPGAGIRGSAGKAFSGLELRGQGMRIAAESVHEMTNAEWIYTNTLGSVRGLPVWKEGPVAITVGANVDSFNAAALWRKDPVDLTKDFTVRLKYYNGRLRDEIAGGIAVVFQNDPRGKSSIGQVGNGLGYGMRYVTGDDGIILNSFAIGLRSHRGDIVVGRNGVFTETNSLNRAKRTLAREDKPVLLTLNYNSSAKTMRVRATDTSKYGMMSGHSADWTVDCDLPVQCGANEAYFGITGSDDTGSPVTHCVENVTIDYSGDKVSGMIDMAGSIAPEGTVKLAAYGSADGNAFLMDSIAYADGLEVETESENRDPDSLRKPYLAFRRWNGTGTVRKTGEGALGIVAWGLESGAKDVDFAVETGGVALRCESPAAIGISHKDGKWTHTGTLSSNPNGVPDYPYCTVDSANGIAVGHTSGPSSGTVTRKERVAVNRNWKMSFSGILSGTGAHGWAVFFHNDPRGTAAWNGVANGNGQFGYGAYHGANPIVNSWAVGFSNMNGYQGVYKYGVNGELEKTNMEDTGNYEMVDLRTFDGSTNPVRNFDFELAYNCELRELNVKLSSAEQQKTFMRTFGDVDLQTICGDGEAYLGFGFDSGGRTTLLKILDFKLEYEKTGEECVFAKSMALGAGETPIRLDAADGDGAYKLAQTVSVADGAVLRVHSENGNAARLSFGTVTAAGDMTIAGLEDETAQVIMPDALTIPEGGTLTVDGIEMVVDKNIVLPTGARLAIVNGGKISVAPGAKLTASRVYVDGVRISGGHYSAANSTWVTGEGVVDAVRFGLKVIIR